MKNSTTILLALIISLGFSNCASDEHTVEKDTKTEDAKANLTNEWIDNPYKLNVVYFIPNDVQPVANYMNRISEILFEFQEITAVNMDREGFGRKSFGLDLKMPAQKNLVNIIQISGNSNKDAYPYSGGGSTVISELNTYFSANPEQKKSEHTLVIMPSTSGDPLNPGGVPFYGLGKYCFALDYEEMKQEHLGKTDQLGNLATKWIGGMLHELGHGLNAPHNKEKASEASSLGTAFMGAGNHTYGQSSTFITGATGATFANSQTFSLNTRTDWYSPVQHKLTALEGRVENNKIIIEGSFESNIAVADIVAYHDPYPAGGNKDYDAPAWDIKPNSDNSFYIESELSEFHSTNGEYQLRLRFYHENGTQVTYSYEYEFQNGIPNIEVINMKDLQDRQNWTVIETSSEEYDAPGSKILDDLQNTVWHTQYRTALPNHPHYFIVDTGAETEVNGFAFANRQNLNGAIKDFEIFGSNDNQTWQSLGQYTLEQVSNWQYIDISRNLLSEIVPTPITYRYYKLQTINSHGNFNYTHLAEFGAY